MQLLAFLALAVLALAFPFEGYASGSFHLLPTKPELLPEDQPSESSGEITLSGPPNVQQQATAPDQNPHITWRRIEADPDSGGASLLDLTEISPEVTGNGAPSQTESAISAPKDDESSKAVKAMAAWRARHAEVMHESIASKRGAGCATCCNDGDRWGAPCVDVDACAAKAPMGGKYAFVYAQVGKPGWPWLMYINSMKVQALALAAETKSTVDIVLIMPPKDVQQLSPRHWDLLRKYSVQLVQVPWVIPPTLKWWPKHWWPGKSDGWCGPQDLVRLHVLGLEGYSAVAFYDQDIEFQGDAGAVLKCAATGRFLSTSGGVGEPLNVGFFAVRPDRRLLRAAEIFAENITFSEQTGWDKNGFKPSGGYFVGAECGQGYFHTLLYQKRSVKAQKALAAAGVIGADGSSIVQAAQLDRCIWNYQTRHECPAQFDCERVRVHHKPAGKPTGPDCAKLSRRQGPPSPLALAQPPPKLPPTWAALECKPQFVNIGANCKCDGENYIKAISAKGIVKACEAETYSGAGDSFHITFKGATITATRVDKRSCWCDDDVEAHCCISTPDHGGETRKSAEHKAERKATTESKADAPAKTPDAAASAKAPTVDEAVAKAGKEPAEWRFQSPEVQQILKSWQDVPRVPKGCESCCHNGERWGVPCFDVAACAKKAKMGGKYAFVYAQVTPPGWPWLTFIDSMKQQAVALAAKTNGTADIVVMIPAEDAEKMNSKHHDLIRKYKVRVVHVPWTIPPALTWWPDDWHPGKTQGWCGPQDLVRAHAFGLVDYDAVAFYDQDIEFQGDASPVLLCASTGKFLSASGGIGEPLNVGFFALRPDLRLLRASEIFAKDIKFSRNTGWGNAGFLPSGGYFVGAECGQGYFHTLIYQRRSAKAREALAAAGLPGPEAASAVDAEQIDRCIWNYQTGSGCPARFDCKLVQVHHKPTSKPVGNDCGKLAFAKTVKSPAPALLRAHGPEAALPCEVQPVKIGANCKCKERSFIKTIDVQGYLVGCQNWIKNPSGDQFSISIVPDKVSKLTTTREDAEACWCDDHLEVKCCVVLPGVIAAESFRLRH